MSDYIVNKIKYLLIGILPLFFYFVLSLVWLIPFIFESKSLVTTAKIVIAILFLAMWGVTACKLEELATLKPLDYGLTHLLGFGLLISALIIPSNSLSEIYYISLSSAFSRQPQPIAMTLSFLLMLAVFILSSKAAKQKKILHPKQIAGHSSFLQSIYSVLILRV